MTGKREGRAERGWWKGRGKPGNIPNIEPENRYHFFKDENPMPVTEIIASLNHQ